MCCDQGGVVNAADISSGQISVVTPIAFSDTDYIRIAGLSRTNTAQNATAGCGTMSASNFKIFINGTQSYSVSWIAAGQ